MTKTHNLKLNYKLSSYYLFT